MSSGLGVTGHWGNQDPTKKAPTLKEIGGMCITFLVGTAGQRPGPRAHSSPVESGSDLGVDPSSGSLCTDLYEEEVIFLGFCC